MPESLEFSLEILNAPSVLPRILLLFARRRLSVHGLHLESRGEWAQLALRLDGSSIADAEQICRQLQRIVEVRSVALVQPQVAVSA